MPTRKQKGRSVIIYRSCNTPKIGKSKNINLREGVTTRERVKKTVGWHSACRRARGRGGAN